MIRKRGGVSDMSGLEGGDDDSAGLSSLVVSLENIFFNEGMMAGLVGVIVP